MSEQHNNGSQHEEHRRAAEMHNNAAHAHLTAAEAQDKRDHLTANEQSRRQREHAQTAYLLSEAAHRASQMFRHAEIEARAHALWIGRGRPEGSADEDWFLAAQQLRGHSNEE